MLNITIAVNHSAATTSAGNTVFPQFFAIGNDPIDFVVQDIAVIMIVVAIMLAITFKLKQPMVIGYIIAGMIIGPYTPPFNLIRSPETLNLFAELGIIMLLFVTGTEFPIAKLRSVGRISIAYCSCRSVRNALDSVLYSSKPWVRTFMIPSFLPWHYQLLAP